MPKPCERGAEGRRRRGKEERDEEEKEKGMQVKGGAHGEGRGGVGGREGGGVLALGDDTNNSAPWQFGTPPPISATAAAVAATAPV
ncbi:hypothetical protein EYF80_009506 [Liparis tanakae]|uniref:Uncharacterized protein n=1 Tax=Liparis tanakae TaxID=230148 RepID=A0A4Z2IQS8_9TELE|nr:hypothetical protein EYF80_009506 [Liparis tanakae]